MLLMLGDSPAPAADPAPAAPAPVAEPQGAGTAKAPPGLRLTWKEHPSVRAGKWLRLDFGVKVHEDKMNPGDDPSDFDEVRLSRARVGVDGEMFKVLQFSIERELTSTGD